MSESLLSVGLDVGTTSTQMVVSRLQVENQAGSFSVPLMEITHRQVCYESPVYFTPLLNESLVDGAALKEIVEKEYAAAGLQRHQVDTGAVIITGETSRKENAATVLKALSEFAGDFVVATAGPDLESVLAAKGAGAVEFSKIAAEPVLHMDIGGGTANLALLRDGNVVATGCLNIGGRLLKLDEAGKILYISPVLQGLCNFSLGQTVTRQQVLPLCRMLVQTLEMAAGKRPPTELLQKLTTEGTAMEIPTEDVIVSFSGGVADCIDKEQSWLQFGDIGPELGRMIRESLLCSGPYRLGQHTIRATVIGAGSHSAQLSGSTVYYQNAAFPMKNLPVVCISEAEQRREDLPQIIKNRLSQLDSAGALALPGFSSPGYEQVKSLAERLVAGMEHQQILVAVEADMAKALGQAMALRLPKEKSLMCIDSVKLTPGSFLDVGAPVGPALPVVIKTLILSH